MLARCDRNISLHDGIGELRDDVKSLAASNGQLDLVRRLYSIVIIPPADPNHSWQPVFMMSDDKLQQLKTFADRKR